MPQPGALLTTGETADRIGVSTDIVRDLASSGHLRVLTLPSGHRRYYAADVDRFVAEHTNIEAAS